MKEKDFVIAGVIGWVAGPFTYVYLGKKTVMRALVELLIILALGYLITPWILIPFVLGYSMLGLIAARRYNFDLNKEMKRQESLKESTN